MDADLPSYIQSVINQVNPEFIEGEIYTKRRKNKHNNNNDSNSSSEEHLPIDYNNEEETQFYQEIINKYSKEKIPRMDTDNLKIDWETNFASHGQIGAFVKHLRKIIAEPNKFKKNKNRFQIIQQIEGYLDILASTVGMNTEGFNSANNNVGNCSLIKSKIKELVYALRFGWKAAYAKKEIEFSEQLGFAKETHEQGMKILNYKPNTTFKKFGNNNYNNYKYNKFKKPEGGNSYGNNNYKKY